METKPHEDQVAKLTHGLHGAANVWWSFIITRHPNKWHSNSQISSGREKSAEPSTRKQRKKDAIKLLSHKQHYMDEARGDPPRPPGVSYTAKSNLV